MSRIRWKTWYCVARLLRWVGCRNLAQGGGAERTPAGRGGGYRRDEGTSADAVRSRCRPRARLPRSVTVGPAPRETQQGAALLRRRPKGLLPAARQELLDPSKAWWGGRRGRLADRPRYSISVSLGVVPRWYSRVVEVPVRIEVAAGFVAPGASEPPRLQPSWPPGGSGPAHG